LGALVFFSIGRLLIGLASLACFVAIVVEMFSHEESGWGVACIILFCCGGPLIAFVYGWTKVGEWNISLLMLAWTLCALAGILNIVLWYAKFGMPPGM
jgi:hypothetical protein